MFFKHPVFKVENGNQYQIFECAAKSCCNNGNRFVKRNIDTGNATSTSNLRAHANKCWGVDTIKAAMGTGSLSKAREVVRDKNNLRQGSITVAFQRAGKEQITYSHRSPTKLESRVHHVRWMVESKRPFALVDDKGYHRNMKEGRPDHYVPSSSTVSRDVKKVFVGAREEISKLLKVCVRLEV